MLNHFQKYKSQSIQESVAIIKPDFLMNQYGEFLANMPRPGNSLHIALASTDECIIAGALFNLRDNFKNFLYDKFGILTAESFNNTECCAAHEAVVMLNSIMPISHIDELESFIYLVSDTKCDIRMLRAFALYILLCSGKHYDTIIDAVRVLF